MKLSDVKKKSTEAREGTWIDDLRNYEGLRLKLRAIGNADWLRIQSTFPPPPADETEEVKEKREVDQLGQLLREAGIVDWNITDENDTPVAYSPDAPEAIELTQDEEVQAAIRFAMIVRAANIASQNESAAKN